MPSWSEAYSANDCKNDLISAFLAHAPQRFEDQIKLALKDKGQPEFVNVREIVDNSFDTIYMVWIGTGTAFSYGPFIVAENDEDAAFDTVAEYMIDSDHLGLFELRDELVEDGYTEEMIDEEFISGYYDDATGKELCLRREGAHVEALIDITSKYVSGELVTIWERAVR